MRLIYTILSYLALPFIFLRLIWRSRRLPAYRSRLGERLGFYPGRWKAAPTLWVHAVSVGEVIAAKPLILALTEVYPTHTILLTTTTPTGAKQAATFTNAHIRHAYLPYDLPDAIHRFFKHFDPEMGVIIETELWPNLLAAWRKQLKPLYLMNARLSQQSARGYQRLGTMTCLMLNTFTAIAAQSEQDAARFIALGASPEKVSVTGNIKFDMTLPNDLLARALTLKNKLGQRLTWIAASTHAGEEEIVLAAHKKIRQHYPDALLILVPRHPDRFASVAKLCEAEGVTQKHSQPLSAQTNVCAIYLADVMGELLLMYALADIAFVGGSLIAHGGHNLLEPASLAKPILSGPFLFNFAAISALLNEAQALIAVHDADSLAKAVLQLHDNPAEADAMGARARAVVKANQGALAKQLALMMAG